MHAPGRVRIGAAHIRLPGPSQAFGVRQVSQGGVHIPDRNNIATHADIKLRQKQLADCPNCDACGSLARRGAFQCRTQIGIAIFHSPGQVGMTGTRGSHWLNGFAAPANGIRVFDQQRQGCAGGASVHYPAQDLNGIFLDLHARAGAIALLAAL